MLQYNYQVEHFSAKNSLQTTILMIIMMIRQ